MTTQSKVTGVSMEETVAVLVANGYSDQEARETWAETVLEGARFVNGTDRVLSRFESGHGRYPSTEELAEQGVDIVALAQALVNGTVTPARVKHVTRDFAAA